MSATSSARRPASTWRLNSIHKNGPFGVRFLLELCGIEGVFLDKTREKLYSIREEKTGSSHRDEDAGIDYIPLKGSVLREYYRNPPMRTSCDIDILVPKDKVDAAASALVTACGYTINGRSGHDISMTAKNGQHLELHFALMDLYMKQIHMLLQTQKPMLFPLLKAMAIR